MIVWGLLTLNHLIVGKLFVLDWNTWKKNEVKKNLFWDSLSKK